MSTPENQAPAKGCEEDLRDTLVSDSGSPSGAAEGPKREVTARFGSGIMPSAVVGTAPAETKPDGVNANSGDGNGDAATVEAIAADTTTQAQDASGASTPSGTASLPTGPIEAPSVVASVEATEAAAPANVPASPAPSAEPVPGVRVRYFGLTDVGLVREHNEDNFLVVDLSTGRRGVDSGTVAEVSLNEKGLVLSVCDGMGGAAAGEVASQLAVDTICQHMSQGGSSADRDLFARCLVDAIEEAGHKIFDSARANRAQRGMGTTTTAAGLIDKVLFLGQVGDSRAHVLRGGVFKQITKDQSLLNQLIEAGQLTEEEAERFEHTNIILQALGTTEEVVVDLTFLELRRGDRLLLCSDGLSGLVHPDMMKEVLESTDDLQACCKRLIEMARAGGGHDNITVICAAFDGADLLPPDDALGPIYQQYPLPPKGTPAPNPMADASTSPPPTRPAAASTDAPSSVAPTASDILPPLGFPVWMIVAVVLLAAAAAVAFYWGGENSEPSTPWPVGQPQEGVPVAAPTTPTPPAVPARLPLRIETDVAGADLYVDGQLVERLQGSPVTLQLAPGAHRVEARSGGTMITTQVVTVGLGSPTSVVLQLPVGATGGPGEEVAPAAAPEPPAVVEPAPAPTAAPEPSPAVAVEPSRDAPPRPRRRRDDAGTRQPIPDNPFL